MAEENEIKIKLLEERIAELKSENDKLKLLKEEKELAHRKQALECYHRKRRQLIENGEVENRRRGRPPKSKSPPNRANQKFQENEKSRY